MSKRFRWLLYLIGALAAMILAATLGVRSAWFKRELHHRIVAALDDATHGQVEIAELQPSLSHLQIVVRGFVLHGAERASEPPLVSIRSLVVGFTPVALIRRSHLIRSFEASDAEVHITRYPDGSTNFPIPGSALEPPRSLKDLFNLSIGRLSLARTNVFWNDQRIPLDLEAMDVALQLRRAKKGRYTGVVSSSAVTLRREGRSFPPINLSAQLDLSEKEIQVASLTWQMAGMTGQTSGAVQLETPLRANVSTRMSGELVALARQLGFREVRGGNFHLEAQATYNQGRLESRGRVQVYRLDVQSPSAQLGSVDLDASYSSDLTRVEIPNFTAFLLGGMARGRAEISWRDGPPRVAIASELRGLDLDRSLRSFPDIPSSVRRLPLIAKVGGRVETTWSGDLKDFSSKFDLNFTTSGPARPGARPVTGFARGEATLARGLRINVRESKFQTAHSTLTAQGALDARQSHVTFAWQTSDFEECRPFLESLDPSWAPIPAALKSNATFAGSMTGPISRPAIQGRLTVGEFVYRGWTWSSLETEVAAASNLLQLSSGRLAGGSSQVTFDFSIGLSRWEATPQSAVRIVAEAKNAQLEGLRDALNIPAPVSGVATGRVELGGNLSNLAGAGLIRVEKATVAGESIDSFSADIRASGPTISLEKIQLAKGRGHLTGQAQIEPQSRAFAAKLNGSGFSLAEIQHFTTGQSGAAMMQGTASFDLTAEGTPEHIQLQSNIDIPNFILDGNSLGHFTGKLHGQGKQLQIQGETRSPDGNLTFDGTTQADGDWPLKLGVQYSNFRADPWLRLWGPHNVTAAVTATGSAEIFGPLKSPLLLEVHSRTQTLQVNITSMTWSNDKPVELSLAHQTLTLSRFQLHGPSTDFQIEGTVQLKDPVNLSITAEGQADAALLTLLDPSLQGKGRFGLKLRATGAPSQPLLFGTLNVDNLSLGYADVPIRLTGLTGEAQLQGDRITITSLRGDAGRGSLTLTGFVTLGDLPRIDLRADLDQARVQYPIEVTDTLSGRLHLTGTSENANLAGEISIQRVSVAEGFEVMTWIAEAVNQASQRATNPPTSTAAHIRLDMGVVSDPDVRLQAHDLRLVATINLRLKGTLADPVAFGDIHTQSGEVLFQGNRYKLTRGDIALTNPFRTTAVLDLEAQTRVEHYDVAVNIAGPADHVRLSYRSDPPLPSYDVLNLLVRGYALQEQALTAGTSAQSIGSAGAGLLLSPALYNEKARRVQRLFGISRFRIDPNASGSTSGGSRITVEEQIAPNVTITYINVTGGPAIQQRIIHFDWDISDRTELIGERDQNGVYGLELRFHQRFK